MLVLRIPYCLDKCAGSSNISLLVFLPADMRCIHPLAELAGVALHVVLSVKISLESLVKTSRHMREQGVVQHVKSGYWMDACQNTKTFFAQHI